MDTEEPGEGAKGLERAVVISESRGLGPELSSRWLRTTSQWPSASRWSSCARGMSEETTHAALAEYADTVDGARAGFRNERTRQEVGELLHEAYTLAIQLVRTHEPALRRAGERLVERRTLSREETGTLFGPAHAGAIRRPPDTNLRIGGKGGYGGKPWKVSLCSWGGEA